MSENSELNLDNVFQWASQAFLETNHHPPLLLAEGSLRVGVVHFNGDIGETSTERGQTFFDLGKVLAEDTGLGDLLRVYFVSEGWSLLLEQGEEIPSSISDHPDRVEILIVSEYSVQERALNTRMAEIVRSEMEEVIGLRPMELPRYSESGLLEALVTAYDIYRAEL